MTDTTNITVSLVIRKGKLDLCNPKHTDLMRYDLPLVSLHQDDRGHFWAKFQGQIPSSQDEQGPIMHLKHYVADAVGGENCQLASYSVSTSVIMDGAFTKSLEQ